MKPVMIAFFLSRDAVREQQDGLNCRSLIPSSGPKQRLRIYFAHVALFVVATVRMVLSLALCRPLTFFLFFFFFLFFSESCRLHKGTHVSCSPELAEADEDCHPATWYFQQYGAGIHYKTILAHQEGLISKLRCTVVYIRKNSAQ